MLLLVGLFGGQFITVQAKDKIDAQDFHDQMRKLWEDHITWTRLVIVGTLPVISDCDDCTGVLADLEASTTRLLQNQDEIGDAIKPFYGEAAGEQLSALLRDHIIIAAQILQAAKNGDPLDDLIASWYDNAHDIAVLLNSVNPEYWPVEDMEAMLDSHLELTLNEAVHYLRGEYAASVADYDQVHLQALEMADMLSNGIIQQFPQKFK